MLAGVAAIGWSVAASASTMNQNTSWTVNRSDTTHEVPGRRVRRLDLRRLPRLDHQRRASRGADGERRVPVQQVGHRHRGDPPHQVRRGGERHLQQQDRRRALVHAGDLDARRVVRDVRQRRPPGALVLRRPDRHLQLRGAEHGAQQLHHLHAARDAGDQHLRDDGHPEDGLEPVLPGLQRGQRARRLHGLDHRDEAEPAERLPALRRAHQLAHLQLRLAERLLVRRLVRAVHGRGLRLERRRRRRLGRAPVPAGGVRGRVRDAHHDARCARRCATRTRISSTPARATTTSSRTTRTAPTTRRRRSRAASSAAAPVRPRRPSAARRSSVARTRCGTSSATSGWARACRSSTRPRPSALRREQRGIASRSRAAFFQARKRIASSAGTPA